MCIPFVLFASFFLCEVSAQAEPIERIINDYFNSESIRKFRRELYWNFRIPLEHALFMALKETVGLPGMNVYIKKTTKEKLATGYFHDDNQVQIIFSNLDLENIPRCWLPEVELSLASNVLKIQTGLSKMIIHADYTLVRNKSDIIHDPKEQDPFKSSPFLFEQVQDVGKVAITMDGCTLSGFIITILNGDSVNLGYHHFKFVNCLYTIEIYRPGDDSPPVIAKYNLYRDDHSLSLTHLLMKPLLTEELVPKLQGTMFSFVNTSGMFGNALREYRENQEIVFQASRKYFTELIRKLNSITVEKNRGSMEMEDYVLWINPSGNNSAGETIILKDMVLTGLDTMYTAHLGGPFKIETVIMADEIRFNSLQVRGKLEVKSARSDTFSFAAEISDAVVDLQMELQGDKGNRRESKRSSGFKRLEVTGFRRITLTVPLTLTVNSLVVGYLIKEVPTLLRSHLAAIFSEAIRKESKTKAPPVNTTPDSDISDDNDDDVITADPTSDNDDDVITADPTSDNDDDVITADPTSDNDDDVITADPTSDNDDDVITADPTSDNDDDVITADPTSDNDDDVITADPTSDNDDDVITADPTSDNDDDDYTTPEFQDMEMLMINRPRRRRRYGSRKRVADNQIRKK